uniref:hypothetical protein n=1 Tax=Parerythrobacter lutipelagi TaxID=1964208 RepID=UPI0010F57119|nr:hypothetical protein [Parerythrobacter lutipelagi]
MSRNFGRLAGAAVALAALAQPVAASAQACLPQEDVSDAVIYAMPLITQAAQTRCAQELADDGYLAASGAAFADRYVSLQDNAWPGAMRLLSQFAGDDAGSSVELIQSLPETALRPFVDAIIMQKVSAEIKPKDCTKIERGMELLAPLPPQNTGDLVSFLFAMTDAKQPNVCKLDSE